jgi:phage tail-like protein
MAVSFDAEIDAGVSVSAGIGVSVGVTAGVGSRRDPYGAYNFAVEVAGVISGGFSEVNGLTAQVDVYDYREGGVNDFVHKIAGPATYPANLTLKRGLTDSSVLWAWHQGALHGAVVRQPVSVILVDTAGAPVWRWDFQDAYPVRWVGPELRAGTGAVALETLELAHRGLAATSGPAGSLGLALAAGLGIGASASLAAGLSLSGGVNVSAGVNVSGGIGF